MATNERLRDALMRSGMDLADLAAQLAVDPKTVERWITKGRSPYPKTRAKAAAVLGESQSYLWPDALSEERRDEVSESEVVRVYPRRSQIDAEEWSRLINGAAERIDMLAMVGLFLPEQVPGLIKTLSQKAKAGAAIRILLGDPDGQAVRTRGEEEGIGEAIVAKVHNVMSFYGKRSAKAGYEVRLHDTTLYNSIYRFDNQMLVNVHVLGLPAAHAPTMKLRQLPGGEMFDIYAESFDTIWEAARPA